MQALIQTCLFTPIKVNTLQSKTLIIVAHGSRKNSSNEEVTALGQELKSLVGNEYSAVATSFLEFASPTLEQSIISAIDGGMKEIVILPYFLAAGKHVTHDIPQIVEKFKTMYPTIEITLKQHLGSSPAMAKLLLELAK